MRRSRVPSSGEPTSGTPETAHEREIEGSSRRGRATDGQAIPGRPIVSRKIQRVKLVCLDGWGGRIRTSVWRNQNPLPYRPGYARHGRKACGPAESGPDNSSRSTPSQRPGRTKFVSRRRRGRTVRLSHVRLSVTLPKRDSSLPDWLGSKTMQVADLMPVFAVIVTGWLAGALGYVARDLSDALIHFAYNVAMPALLIVTIAHEPARSLLAWRFLIAFGGGSLVCFAIVFAWLRALRGQGLAEAAMQGWAASMTNTGFVALPVLQATYGRRRCCPRRLRRCLSPWSCSPRRSSCRSSTPALGRTVLRLGNSLAT